MVSVSFEDAAERTFSSLFSYYSVSSNSSLEREKKLYEGFDNGGDIADGRIDDNLRQ